MQEVMRLGHRRDQRAIDWIKLGDYTFAILDSELTIVTRELHLRLNSNQLTIVECADAAVGVFEGELKINEAPAEHVVTPFLLFQGPKITYTILAGVLNPRADLFLDMTHELSLENEKFDRTILNLALRNGQAEHFLQVMRDARKKFAQK